MNFSMFISFPKYIYKTSTTHTFPFSQPPLIGASPAMITTEFSAKIPVSRQPSYINNFQYYEFEQSLTERWSAIKKRKFTNPPTP